jgi:hypothetical protein
MKNPQDETAEDQGGELRDEYDFRHGVRGKCAARYAEGTNLVLLDADVVRVFPASTAVNEALRALVKIIERQSSAA